MKRLIIIVIIVFMTIGCKLKQDDSIKKNLIGKKYRGKDEIVTLLKNYKYIGGTVLVNNDDKFSLTFASSRDGFEQLIIIKKYTRDGMKLPLNEIIDVITVKVKPNQDIIYDDWNNKNIIFLYHNDQSNGPIVDKAWIASVNASKTGVDLKEISPLRVVFRMEDDSQIVELKE